jgi:small conductance mechanosensitive channel
MFRSLTLLPLLAVLSIASALAQPAAETATAPQISVISELTTDLTQEQIKLLAAPLTMEQLAEQAAAWQTGLQEQMSQIASLKIAALEAVGAAADALTDRIIPLSDERNEAVEKFLVLVDALERKGGDPAVVQGYRDYVKAALAAEWAATDPSTLLSAAWEWLTSFDGGVGILLRLLAIFASLFVLVIVARFVRGLVNRALKRAPSLSHLLKDFLLKSVFWLTFAVGFMIVLGLFGVDITPLFAVIGGASFIIAFAMQETLGNLAAGLMIMVNKPFDVGDLVDTNGILGQVEPAPDQDRGLLDRLLGSDQVREGSLRQRGRVHPLPAAGCAPVPGRLTELPA